MIRGFLEKTRSCVATDKQCSATGLQLLKRHVPILSWLPRYTKMDAVSDVIAGITIGLTLMPQSIAYAALAGLDPQYGLYSSFVGSFVYVFCGTIKEVSIGPTALMSLMTYEYTRGRGVEYVVLLTFLCGCVELLLGLLRLGFLVEFISIPVISGFTSATAVIIACSQLKGLLGLKFEAETFIDVWKQLAANIHEARVGDSMLGVACIVCLLLLRKINALPLRRFLARRNEEKAKKILWFVSIGRNAIVVVTSSVAAYFFRSAGQSHFVLSGQIEPGLPSFRLPQFSTENNNNTVSFLEMCQELGSGIVVVPIVAVLGNVAIAKAFASTAAVDATQEMLTLGVCNVLGACVQSIPTTGSFSRSAVNNASGVRSPMGGLYSGTMILLALSLLTPYFFYIPRATLAAVLICAVIFMVEVRLVRPLWKSSKRDLFTALLTFVACLILNVEVGLSLGIVADAGFMLYSSARPSIAVEIVQGLEGVEYALVTPQVGFHFPAADLVRTTIVNSGRREGRAPLPVVVNCINIRTLDYTSAKSLSSVIEDFSQRGQALVFLHPKANVMKALEGADAKNVKYCATEEELEIRLTYRVETYSVDIPAPFATEKKKDLDVDVIHPPRDTMHPEHSTPLLNKVQNEQEICSKETETKI